mmetsp:Transcript_93731/g.303531  ORF Transcript_93731/g.303531 Transcript_93731/m.303531 type:complete len:205 (-) Transcript_93731:2014-2628(-)
MQLRAQKKWGPRSCLGPSAMKPCCRCCRRWHRPLAAPVVPLARSRAGRYTAPCGSGARAPLRSRVGHSPPKLPALHYGEASWNRTGSLPGTGHDSSSTAAAAMVSCTPSAAKARQLCTRSLATPRLASESSHALPRWPRQQQPWDPSCRRAARPIELTARARRLWRIGCQAAKLQLRRAVAGGLWRWPQGCGASARTPSRQRTR